MSKKKSILLLIFLLSRLCGSGSAESVYVATDLNVGMSGPYGMMAGQLLDSNITSRDVGVIYAASMHEVSTALACSSYIFTTDDIVLFSYEDETRVEIYDSVGNPIPVEPNVLDAGEHVYVDTSLGVYIVAGSNKFAVLTGDAMTKKVSGYYAMDANGRGVSREFYTCVPALYEHCEFIIFAYDNGTNVTVQQEIANGVYEDIASFTIDKGEHWANSSISAKYLHITADKPVSALTCYDQSYFVPSADGTWSGTEFYTYVNDIGSWAPPGWPEDLTVIAYNDDTFVSVKNSETQELIWEGTLDGGQAHAESYPKGANKHFTITSNKPVTVSVQPWVVTTTGYYQGAFIPDRGGTGVGTDLIGSSLDGGYLYILAYMDDTRVDLYDSKTESWVASYDINSGDIVNANPGNGLWKIVSNKSVSAYSGWGDLCIAEFAPLAFNKGLSTLEKFGDVKDGDCRWPGDEITYTINYNYPAGPNCYPDFSDVNIMDYLPTEVDFVSAVPEPNEIIDCNKIIWKIGALHPGDEGSITLKVRIKCIESGSTTTNYCEMKSGDEVLNRTYEYISICANYLVVEDFEGYIDGDSIREVWHGTGGADINISTYGDGIIHRGTQAMAITYNNSLSYSETYAEADEIDNVVGTNWRLKDVKVLSVWLHGIGDLRGSYTGTDPYTLEGDGAGIDDTKYDTCYFFYKEIDDLTATVEARVDSIENTNPSAMAGVMMRDKINANSVYYATVVTPDGRVIFMGRSSPGATSSAFANTHGNTPHWVRITRYPTQTPPVKVLAEHANDVGGSPDKWSTIGEELPLYIGPLPTYIGLCVTSNIDGDMCTAELSNVYMAEDTAYYDPDGDDVGDPDTGVDLGSYVYNDPEPMYVGLKDSDSNAIWYYPGSNDANYADPCATRIGTWTEWRIDLNDFVVQGVDVCDVRKIYIGIGDKNNPSSSGSGTVFIDDIRLYLSICPDRPAGDLNCDCAVDCLDLKIMTDEWLSKGCLRTDLYEDGKVDFRDLAILSEKWLENKRWPAW